MFNKLKANLYFHLLFTRPNIRKAYAMVKPTDSWYNTITTVHNSLAQIQKLPHQCLEITSHDGYNLKAVYYPGESDVTVICAHGYTSHAEREWAFPGLFYHSLGYNVLIPYQRAHGISAGKYISLGALEHRDMMGWVDRINEITPDGQIILHGLSMGGEIVLYLADKDLKNVKCLVVDAPNVSIDGFLKGVATHVFKKNSTEVYKHLTERFHKEFSLNTCDFEAVDMVKGSRYPILLAAGSNENMEEIFRDLAAANPQETEVVILPGCDHGNGMYKQTEMFQTAIRDFIAKYVSEVTYV